MESAKHIFVLIIIIALIGLVARFVSPEDEKVPTVTVTVPVSAEPEDGFDPVYGWGMGDHVHEPLIQSTLTRTTVDMRIENDLATGYEVSKDGMVWTVKIREDVKFTNGDSLTAKDVAFTYNRCKEEGLINDFDMMKEAVATDKTTVEFHMEEPFSPWQYTMTKVGIVPESIYDEGYGQNPVGSGRYMVKSWQKGEELVLVENPKYYGQPLEMKKVIVKFMDEDEALEAANNKQVDVAHTGAAYADEKKVGGYKVKAIKSVDNRGINLPAVEVTEEDGKTYGNQVLCDVNVRRAINIGIDRKELVKEALRGYGEEAFGVCDKMPWFNEDSKVEFDLEEAKRILEESGWVDIEYNIRHKEGKPAIITIYYGENDSLRADIAKNLKSQLWRLGIYVNLQGVDFDDTYEAAHTNPVVWGYGSYSPMSLYDIYHSSKDLPGKVNDISPYVNEAVDENIDKAIKEQDPMKSIESWKSAQWDGENGVTQQGDVPWVWLCNVDHLYFVRENLVIPKQKIHPHAHGWSILNNVDQWYWK